MPRIAREQGKADDDVEPLLDHLAVDAVELDHQVGEHGGHDQLPDAFDPEMDDVPPVHLVDGEVRRIVEREQEEDRNAPQAEQQDVGHRGLAALERRHGHVEQEHQADHDDADLDDEGLLEEFAALVVVEEIADHGDAGRAEEHPELDLGEQRAVQLGLGLFREQEVGRPHEADQRPYDQRVGMDHPDDVERQEGRQRVGQDVDGSGEQAEQDLGQEQRQRAVEIQHRDFLGLIFHLGSLCLERGLAALNRPCSAASPGA
ncbi:hypothetical protein ACVIWV_004562 [Bradyrhizobium diazoefficiens]